MQTVSSTMSRSPCRNFETPRTRDGSSHGLCSYTTSPASRVHRHLGPARIRDYAYRYARPIPPSDRHARRAHPYPQPFFGFNSSSDDMLAYSASSIVEPREKRMQRQSHEDPAHHILQTVQATRLPRQRLTASSSAYARASLAQG